MIEMKTYADQKRYNSSTETCINEILAGIPQVGRWKLRDVGRIKSDRTGKYE